MTSSKSIEVDPAFRIMVDAAGKLVTIDMFGFWTLADLERFDRDLRAALKRMASSGCRIGDQVTLFDATTFNVQSQPITAHLAAMAADPSIGSRKIAVVLASGLLKLQAKRTAPDYCLFDDRTLALAWLRASD